MKLKTAISRLAKRGDKESQLVLRALKMLDQKSQHTDDADMSPIFTTKLECLWTNGDSGILHCLGMAIENEDAPEGAYCK